MKEFSSLDVVLKFEMNINSDYIGACLPDGDHLENIKWLDLRVLIRGRQHVALILMLGGLWIPGFPQ